MADFFKALIVELNGSELDDAQEYDVRASTIPIESDLFDADNVRDAIIEARSTYSWRIIDRDITVPFNNQMVVYQEFCVEAGKELTINGEVAVIL